MARPLKDGIDYFSLDCQMDDEIKYIEAEFGLDGFAMIIKLWQKIYGDKGYYCAFPRTVRLMFAQSINKGVGFVDEVINRCIEYGIFDRRLYKKYGVLSSAAIQRRYAKATERRNSFTIDGRYLLISAPKNWVIANINSVNADNNGENADNCTESKVNVESKNGKEKEITTTTTTESACVRESEDLGSQGVENSAPNIFDVAKYFNDNEPKFESKGKATIEASKFIAYNAKRGWDCLPDWKKAADLWVARIADKNGGKG
jgi:hypothetical protein